MGIEEFIKEHHPDIWEQYKAKTDPNYFVVGQHYQPMRSGFGGAGKRYKTLIYEGIKDGMHSFSDLKPDRDGHLGYGCDTDAMWYSMAKPIKEGKQ